MKKKALIFSLLAMLGLVGVGGWYFISQNQTQAVKAEARKHLFNQAVRLFFSMVGAQAVVRKDIWPMQQKTLV